jgi:PST family polysaccharide transporter
MSLQQKAAKGIFWSVIQKWGRELISLLILMILSRLLDPEAFGLVALATIFTTFIEIFLDQGFGAAIVQRDDLDREHLDTAFWTSVLTGVLFAVVGIAAAGLVAAFFSEPDLAPILRWLSITFILGGLSSTQMSILQRDLAFKSLATRSLIAKVIGGIAGVAMAVAGFGVWSLVGQKIVAGLAGVLVLWWASEWRPGFHASRKHFRELFNYGISILGSKSLDYFGRRTDEFLIGYFLGPTMLGYYSVGYRLLLVLLRVVVGITNAVAFPTFSRLQGNPERMRRAFYRVTQYTSLLAIPAFIGLAILAPELVPALFGEQWLPSVPVMQVLALIGILQSVLAFNASVIKAAGKPSWHFGILFLTSVCSVIGFLIAVRWGIVAVAAAFVIVGYLVAPVSYLAVRKLIEIEFRTYLRQFVAPFFAALVMVLVVVGLRSLVEPQGLHMILELAVLVTAGSLTYLAVIALIARPLARQVIELVRLALPDQELKEMLKKAPYVSRRVS